ncbi:unnamed protein product [Nippostrongylus brasiliensis]|uniref:DUF4880 domain-containing protein n=1 Tax=Nippostrongylus brasiliensis TaxID=27835 RepID=A0A0N4Y8X6_NIPBR|nr:unnamed protein product [Nippostrongylus brasiliensis]
MKNVSHEAQMELISVFANETMTIAEQKKAVGIWGEEHGIKASRALQSISLIMLDDEITWSQRKSKMKQLEAEYPEAMQVLKVAFEQPLIEGVDQNSNQWNWNRHGYWRP